MNPNIWNLISEQNKEFDLEIIEFQIKNTSIKRSQNEIEKNFKYFLESFDPFNYDLGSLFIHGNFIYYFVSIENNKFYFRKFKLDQDLEKIILKNF